jgi:hypothetical protein
MSTLRLTLWFSLLAGCSPTGIPTGADLGPPDLATADRAGQDLAAAGPDLATAGPDLATAGPDLAAADQLLTQPDQGGTVDGGARVGVACGNSWCDTTTGAACCELALSCQATPCALGEQTDRCDGPEDCPSGNVCCLFVGNTFYGTACAPSCGQQARICHSAADCAPGQGCGPLEASGFIMGCY